MINDNELVLGGFIQQEHFAHYQDRLTTTFPDIRCRWDTDNLIRIWSSKPKKPRIPEPRIPEYLLRQVMMWHEGFRDGLKLAFPNQY